MKRRRNKRQSELVTILSVFAAGIGGALLYEGIKNLNAGTPAFGLGPTFNRNEAIAGGAIAALGVFGIVRSQS